MQRYKVTFTAATEIDVWLDADNEDHAAALVAANDRATYSRIRSTVSVGTGSIRIDTATISIDSIALVD